MIEQEYGSATHLLEMREITKDFPGVRALDRVNLYLDAGEVLGLVGENGAGKSTLMNILSGVYPAGTFSGEIHIKGKKTVFKSVKDAQNVGIAIIHQELSLVPKLTVMENIFLGREPRHRATGIMDREEMYFQAQTLLTGLGLAIHPEAIIETLSIGQQQMIEIARSLSVSSRIVVMDEPTSALTDKEIERLFDFIRNISAKGVAVIYISHKLEEVLEITRRIEVILDGQTVGGGLTRELTQKQIIALMVGRELNQMYPPAPAFRTAPARTVLAVKNLICVDREKPDKMVVNNISFELQEGEIIGLAGLMGAGRTELAEAIFGLAGKKIAGSIEINGVLSTIRAPDDAIKEGIGFVTEDRKLNGVIYRVSLRKNISLPSLDRLSYFYVMDEVQEEITVNEYIARLRIKAASPDVPVETLSGGNQQKAIIAKWLARKPRVLIMDEPTRGIDVAAKSEIHLLIRQLAAEGVGVIMISSELPEILGISDRILVIRENAIAGELDRDNASQEAVMHLAMGAGAVAAHSPVR